jgi:hypothetical protein
MALKGDRIEVLSDISYFMNSVAERGGIVSLSGTGGSGAAMDQAANLVAEVANPSGAKPVGILMQDVVNIDLTRQHLNHFKAEVQKGGKVCVLRQGYVVTNKIQGNPTAGSPAYVGHSGLFSTTNVGGASYTAMLVGEFRTSKDQDGYAKVDINLPATNR